MCLITFAYKQHPQYRLILAANRDEFYDRDTLPAEFWLDKPDILAGRDLQAGGTWLGINRNGRFAAITNYREGNPSPAPLSRGHLVADFLDNTSTTQDYLRSIEANQKNYNDYNLLVDDGQNMAYCSNRHHHPQILSSGVYGLSNHLLNTPWPKLQLACHNLKSLLDQDTLTPDRLIEVLASKALFDDKLLPATNIDPQLERALSAPFIDIDGYGTRCSTALLIDYKGNIKFLEQSFLRGEKIGQPIRRQLKRNQD
jgi:uncharacterized protein with NRDE domain